jgi:hypothetical protein
MNSPLQYSVYDNIEAKNSKRSKTYKKRPTKKVKHFLEAMQTNDMGDYEEPAKSPSYPSPPQKPNPLMKKKEKEKSDAAVENFTQLPNFATTEEYYKQYVPYYTNVENSSQLTGSNRNELMEKLNYMIHLLEEQQEDKTSNVSEELILYLFLGIFVIFVVDSFARAGKYTR